MSKGFKISMGILGLFILAIIILVRIAPTDILSYKIIGKKDISYLNTPRMVYRVALEVEKVPDKENMEKTAIEIWRDGNKKWKEFTVFMYLPEMNTEGIAYGIGEFTPNGLKEFQMMDIALYGTKWEDKYLKEEKKRVEKAKEELELKKQDQKIKEYHVNLDVNKTAPRNIKIDVTTDFPDGTNFHIGVDRIYNKKGSSANYSGDIFNKDIPIKSGKIQVEVYINDSLWYNKYYEYVKKLGHLVEFPGVGQISPKIEVSVMFSPRRKQSDEVLKILGTNGEFVGGAGAKKWWDFTTYSVTRLVDIPFQK